MCMGKSVPYALMLLVAITGCAEDDVRGPVVDSGADTGTSADSSFPTDAPDRDGAGADTGTGSDAGVSEGLSIVFDYRFDTSGFFADPARREVLEAAAAVWGMHLADDFEDIPAGTSIRTRNPETPAAGGMSFPTETAIDDVLIFAACASFEGGTAQSNNTAALASVTDTALRARLRERYEGSDFEPWTGWIAFNCDEAWFFDMTPETDTDIPGSDNDFFSTAMHEIGHVLGFGTADAYFALVPDGDSFMGVEAVRVYGGPVPLTPDNVHFQSSVRSDGLPTLMDPSRTVGTRTPPTSVDRAVMFDLGYEPSGR